MAIAPWLLAGVDPMPRRAPDLSVSDEISLVDYLTARTEVAMILLYEPFLPMIRSDSGCSSFSSRNSRPGERRFQGDQRELRPGGAYKLLLALWPMLVQCTNDEMGRMKGRPLCGCEALR